MVYTTWGKDDLTHAHHYWESFNKCVPQKYFWVILHQKFTHQKCPRCYLFCLFVCAADLIIPIHSQQVVLKIRRPNYTRLESWVLSILNEGGKVMSCSVSLADCLKNVDVCYQHCYHWGSVEVFFGLLWIVTPAFPPPQILICVFLTASGFCFYISWNERFQC